MNFTITIKSTGKQDIDISVRDATITVYPKATKDALKVKCIVRPDSFLQVRSNVVTQNGIELTHATILQSDPVNDPNHWLKRTEQKYYKRPPDSQKVIDRRRNIKGRKKS